MNQILNSQILVAIIVSTTNKKKSLVLNSFFKIGLSSSINAYILGKKHE